jgi:hypothetical protein
MEIQKHLYRCLILYKKISLPGIGTIFLHRHPAQLDFGNRQIYPPAFQFKLKPGADKPSKKLYDRLSSLLSISEWEAIKAVNDFSFDIKNKLSSAGEALWDSVGIFRRDEKGNITLDSTPVALPSEMPVTAEKVIREHAEHTLLVGEQEKTSLEMQEYFAESPAKKDYSMAVAVILVFLSLIFTGWYFSGKGINPASAGNQHVIKPK